MRKIKIHSSSLRRAVFALCLGWPASGALDAQVTPSLQSFVAVTPCRVVDTRYATGAFGPPLMAAKTTRSFPFPSSSCGLPANATAYSVNVTVVPVSGLGYLTIFPTGSTIPVVSLLNDFEATIIANAAIVPAGANGALSVYVTDPTDVIIDVNGYFVATSNTLTSNTSVGQGALPLGSGGQNTAIGASVLASNTNGSNNTAAGATALSSNSSGSYNTAYGQGSMMANASGSNNTAVGFQTLSSEGSAQNNTAVGYQAMLGATGSSNVAIGSGAGANLTSGSNNIYISNGGGSTDSGVIRIGTSPAQTATYIAAISGVNITGGAAVVVNGNGQLGVMTSSRRYKQDIQPMADSSDRLMELQPVTFHYKQPGADGSQPLQYGLIAEEVAAVYPELAVYGKDGQVETLQYQQLPALLLNEIQKQHRTIEDLQARLAKLEKLMKAGTVAAGH